MVCALLVLFFTLGISGAVVSPYATPGTGKSWTMDDLVKYSGGALTGADGDYALHNDLEISLTDAVTMAVGDTLTVDAGPGIRIWVYGTLNAQGADENGIIFSSTGTTAGDWYGI